MVAGRAIIATTPMKCRVLGGSWQRRMQMWRSSGNRGNIPDKVGDLWRSSGNSAVSPDGKGNFCNMGTCSKKTSIYSSFIRITIFEIIAAMPPVVMPDEKMFFTVSGN